MCCACYLDFKISAGKIFFLKSIAACSIWDMKAIYSGMVSIIIPSYNRAHLIGKTIESVLNQNLREFELIIVDDGSTDATAEVVRSYGRLIQYLFQENQGRSGARNAGFEASRGSYICFLDSDDLLLSGMLEQEARLLESNPALGFVYCDYEFIDESGRGLPKPENFRRHPLRKGMIFRDLMYFDFIPPSTVLSRRECIEQAGGFDPAMEPAEDLDWLLRMSRRYATDFIPAPLCQFRKHEGNTSSSAIAAATIRVLSRHLDDEATKRSLGTDWERVYYDLYLSIAHEYYNRREMISARKYYYRALEVAPSKKKDPVVLGLILKSYLGLDAMTFVRRIREGL
jgi:glycosyltransferase involved in cell wall biosynthesis